MKLYTPGDAAPVSASRYLLPDERQVVTVRMHPATLLGPICLVLGGLVVAALVSGVADANTTAVTITWLAWGVLVINLTWKVANWSVAFLIVTSNCMLIIYGLANRKVGSMSFATVTDINLRRSVTGRLLGYGELVVEASGQDQAWAKVGFVPFPVQVYNEICLLADARDPIMRSVMRIQNALGPVSLFKIVRSLELASGNQDQDSPSVARERFYGMVADRFQEDESLERRPELRHYLGDYRNYLRRRTFLAFIRRGVIYLIAATLLAALASYGWRWAEHDPLNQAGLVIVVVSVSVPAFCLEWLLRQRIRSLGSQSTSAAQRAEQQVPHEFKTIWSELSVDLAQAAERRFDPMLRTLNAPTLIELESPRVQRSATRRGVTVTAGQIRNRSLVVAIPGAPSASQYTAMYSAYQYGLQPNVNVAVQYVVMSR